MMVVNTRKKINRLMEHRVPSRSQSRDDLASKGSAKALGLE